MLLAGLGGAGGLSLGIDSSGCSGHDAFHGQPATGREWLGDESLGLAGGLVAAFRWQDRSVFADFMVTLVQPRVGSGGLGFSFDASDRRANRHLLADGGDAPLALGLIEDCCSPRILM